MGGQAQAAPCYYRQMQEMRGRDWIESAPPAGGAALLRAWFAGRAFARHRHDTYAVCVTDRGLQGFDYRGAAWTSAPGQVVVLHPDEPHDGRAAAAEGFGYRIAYVAPDRIAAAARALCGAAVPLPFLGDPVLTGGAPARLLARAVGDAFRGFPAAPEPLAADALVEGLARGLVAADPSIRRRRRGTSYDLRALARARDFLDAEKARVVTSAELEAISGQDRYALARHFREAYGTSPYRYLLMRRLDWVQREIVAGRGLAEIALAAGFADQAHLTRMFKAAFGLSPAKFRAAASKGGARN
jgi:AraC-like DNA-binding protein